MSGQIIERDWRNELKDIQTSSNQILYQQKKGTDNYYVPGYMRMKIKSFNSMDLTNMNFLVNTTIIFNIYLGQQGQLPQQILQLLDQNQMVLLFNRDQPLRLNSEDNCNTQIFRDYKKNQIKFTIRKMLNTRIFSDVFWTPLQLIKLIVNITVQPLIFSTKEKVIKCHFNLMDITQEYNEFSHIKLSYERQLNFGHYDLAEKLLRSQYKQTSSCYLDLEQQENLKSKKKPNTQQIQKQKPEVKSFQYAHFIIPLYKYPSVPLLTIFVPLLLLGAINLGIFFQNNLIQDRVASIATLVIAFAAIIPTIRNQIPPNPNVVFIQFIVYAHAVASFCALMQSFEIYRINPQEFQQQQLFIWYKDPFYMIALLILIITFIVMVVIFLYHHFYLKGRYNVSQQDKQQKQVFKRKQWRNPECDKIFQKLITSKQNAKKNAKIDFKSQLLKKQQELEKLFQNYRSKVCQRDQFKKKHSLDEQYEKQTQIQKQFHKKWKVKDSIEIKKNTYKPNNYHQNINKDKYENKNKSYQRQYEEHQQQIGSKQELHQKQKQKQKQEEYNQQNSQLIYEDQNNQFHQKITNRRLNSASTRRSYENYKNT